MGEVESRDLFNSNDLALIHPLYLEDKAIQLKFQNDNLGSLVSEQVTSYPLDIQLTPLNIVL